MLLSMTGFGEAHLQRPECAVAVELHSINNKYFKLSVRCDDNYSSLESQIESVVRQTIKRGTVTAKVRVDHRRHAEDYAINADVLNGYRRQLEALCGDWKTDVPPLETLLALPGVIDEQAGSQADIEADWPLIREALEAALASLSRMREDEGRAMAADLAANCAVISENVKAIDERSPLVVEAYRSRLTERLNKILAEYQISLQPGDLVREIAVYAERSDIREEIVRLKSHLEQFAGFLNSQESVGRKLEFLTQEMFRETNTIGSKSNDVEIARYVIEMKSAIERIREMIQNVE